MTNLNTLIPPGSPLYLTYGAGINDRGEIAGTAFDPNTGESPAFLAIPCDERHAGNEGGEDGVQAASAARGEPSQNQKLVLPENVRKHLRMRLRFGLGQ